MLWSNLGTETKPEWNGIKALAIIPKEMHGYIKTVFDYNHEKGSIKTIDPGINGIYVEDPKFRKTM